MRQEILLAPLSRFSLILVLLACFSAPAFDRSVAARQISRQIGTYSDRVDISQRLGVSGTSAYILTGRSSNRGLYIAIVNPGSLAARMGLEQGDVLLQVNSRVVTSTADADRILAATPSGQLKCVFVKQTAQALNCYNQTVAYTNDSPSDGNAVVQSAFTGSRDVTMERIVTSVPVQTLESYMCEIVNADRAANGVGRVSLSGALSAVARAHAEDIVKRKFFAHVNPSGQDPRDRAVAAGISVTVAENLATKSGPDSPQKKVAACEAMMMNEPKNDPHNHRGNILNASWVCVGIGCAYGPGGSVVAVQEFSPSNVP